MLLEQIQSPADVKKLSRAELQTLVDECRQALLQKLEAHGGHNGPNLGVVEMTVALHYVFDSPRDNLIWDVSHQSYVHKMLTGRQQAFTDPVHYDDVSGYTNPHESEHDYFSIGHTSTSLSLASGFIKAREVLHKSGNIIAVIGDGSLSGGMAYEGLNTIADENQNAIVIVNDNENSIAPNPRGGLYTALRTLRESNGQASDNLFKALGYEYHYLEAGNDLEQLIDLFQTVKNTDHPVLLHVHTEKGHGYAPAVANHEKFHAGGPIDLTAGVYYADEQPHAATYSDFMQKYLFDKMQADEDIVTVSSGTPQIIFTPEQRQQLGSHFIDVGIAEEEAVAMTSAMAKYGAKPVYPVFATFLQRTFDQVAHDLALNNNPATFLVYLAGVYGMNDESHLGLFDIQFLSHIPNMVYLAPTNQEELQAMADWAIDQTDHPVAIRVPATELISTGVADDTDYSQLNRNQVVQQGSQVAIFGVGEMLTRAQAVAAELAKIGIDATVINPRYLTGLDEALLSDLPMNHQVVVTLEDGFVEGGYGQMVASALGTADVKVKNYGLTKEFHDRYDAEGLLTQNGMAVEQIVADVKQLLNN